MLSKDNTVLVVIDVQEKLMRVMHERDALVTNLEKLVQGANALGLPIIWLEQNPRGLGPTVPEVARHLDGRAPIEKLSFSCCGTQAFQGALDSLGRNQVLLCGIEAHVCVYQTARDLLDSGREVEVVADAVSSRVAENKAIALRKIESAGGKLSCVEMALFELLGAAEGDAFKAVLKIVK